MSDRDVVRSLAAQLAEAAHRDEMAFRRRLWRDVHSLRLPERPPVICHAGCWHELIPASAYVCQDPWLRQLEAPMRQSLYKLTIGDDTRDLKPGDSWCIPDDMEHEAVAVADTVALEVFAPVREDYLPAT